MEAITKEQYLSALEIVNAYHAQIIGKIKAVEKADKVLLSVFLEENNTKMSARLYHAVKFSLIGHPNYRYVDDLTPERLRIVRGFGRWSIAELMELIKESKQ